MEKEKRMALGGILVERVEDGKGMSMVNGKRKEENVRPLSHASHHKHQARIDAQSEVLLNSLRR